MISSIPDSKVTERGSFKGGGTSTKEIVWKFNVCGWIEADCEPRTIFETQVLLTDTYADCGIRQLDEAFDGLHSSMRICKKRAKCQQNLLPHAHP